MKLYTCTECGEEYEKFQLDPDFRENGYYLCKSCAITLAEAGRDAVDPNGEFDSFSDWDENGH